MIYLLCVLPPQFLKFAHDYNLMPDLIGRSVIVRMISEVMAAR
jgi:hypothetical protein